jgi:formamidopyrimidine-DNA glycosylase
MPELPEVETFRRYVERTSLHRPIVGMDIRNDIVIRGVDRRTLQEAVEGSEFTSTRRHGKRLFLELGRGGWLTWHFGMTGRPVLDGEDERFARVLFLFPAGSLAFVDPRMLGRIGLASSPERYIEERALGPDALEIKRGSFVDSFRRVRAPIKAALMDQRKVAGIGNLYADEMLFQCRLDPRVPACSLTENYLGCLHRAMRRVLRRSIEVGTDFFGSKE